MDEKLLDKISNDIRELLIRLNNHEKQIVFTYSVPLNEETNYSISWNPGNSKRYELRLNYFNDKKLNKSVFLIQAPYKDRIKMYPFIKEFYKKFMEYTPEENEDSIWERINNGTITSNRSTDAGAL